MKNGEAVNLKMINDTLKISPDSFPQCYGQFNVSKEVLRKANLRKVIGLGVVKTQRNYFRYGSLGRKSPFPHLKLSGEAKSVEKLSNYDPCE